MKKTVSVAIPVYNGEKYILEAMQSIVDQTLGVDKIWISDNCSNDTTITIVNKFIHDHQEFDIELSINEENIGFQNNFYKCFDLARTDYLLVLHADDVLKLDTIEKQINFFDKHEEFAAVGGNVDTIDSKGNILNKSTRTKDMLFRKNEIYEFIKATRSYITESTIMYNLELTGDISVNKEESLGPEELYWPVLLQRHGIAVLADSLIYNRIHGDQLHISYAVTMFDAYRKHFRDLLNISTLEIGVERQNKTRKLLKKQISKMSISLGNNAMKYKGNNKIASKYYFYGIQKYPSLIFTKFFFKSIYKSIKLN